MCVSLSFILSFTIKVELLFFLHSDEVQERYRQKDVWLSKRGRIPKTMEPQCPASSRCRLLATAVFLHDFLPSLVLLAY
jgi:hypothetical protein